MCNFNILKVAYQDRCAPLLLRKYTRKPLSYSQLTLDLSLWESERRQASGPEDAGGCHSTSGRMETIANLVFIFSFPLTLTELHFPPQQQYAALYTEAHSHIDSCLTLCCPLEQKDNAPRNCSEWSLLTTQSLRPRVRINISKQIILTDCIWLIFKVKTSKIQMPNPKIRLECGLKWPEKLGHAATCKAVK